MRRDDIENQSFNWPMCFEKDRQVSLAVIIDHCTREILGWRLSDNSSGKTAEAALVNQFYAWPHSSIICPVLRQRPRLQQSALCDKDLRTHPGVHDALHAGAKRVGSALLIFTKGRMHLAASVRIAGPGPSGDRA